MFSVPMLRAVVEVERLCPVQPRGSGRSAVCGAGLNVTSGLNADSCVFPRGERGVAVSGRRGVRPCQAAPGTDASATGVVPGPGGFVAGVKKLGCCKRMVRRDEAWPGFLLVKIPAPSERCGRCPAGLSTPCLVRGPPGPPVPRPPPRWGWMSERLEPLVRLAGSSP